MPILYVMCGLAFSGKSTAAHRVGEALGASVVGLDALHTARGLDPGQDITPGHWEETSRQAVALTKDFLSAGRSVVVDDTFSYRFQRDRFHALAADVGACFLILFMDVPEQVIEARVAGNRARPARFDVHPEVLAHIRREFERPADDEPVQRFTNQLDFETWLAGIRRQT